MQKDEKVSSLISIDSFDSEESLVLCTEKGVVKKTKSVRIEIIEKAERRNQCR